MSSYREEQRRKYEEHVRIEEEQENHAQLPSERVKKEEEDIKRQSERQTNIGTANETHIHEAESPEEPWMEEYVDSSERIRSPSQHDQPRVDNLTGGVLRAFYEIPAPEYTPMEYNPYHSLKVNGIEPSGKYREEEAYLGAPRKKEREEPLRGEDAKRLRRMEREIRQLRKERDAASAKQFAAEQALKSTQELTMRYGRGVFDVSNIFQSFGQGTPQTAAFRWNHCKSKIWVPFLVDSVLTLFGKCRKYVAQFL